MSEMNQEASSRRRWFTDEFKRDSVRLVAEEGYTFKAGAVAVGVSDQTFGPGTRGWPRSPSRVASTPRLMSFAKRTNGFAENCVAPNRNATS